MTMTISVFDIGMVFSIR